MGLVLGRVIRYPIRLRLLPLVFPVKPSQTSSYLREVRVRAVGQHLPDDSAGLVCFRAFQRHRLAEHEVRQILLRSLSEVLLSLRGIDPGHADFELLLSVGKDRDCVAVADRYDLAGLPACETGEEERHGDDTDDRSFRQRKRSVRENRFL